MSGFALYAQPAHEMTAEDRADEADERREEYIEDFAPVEAKKILGRECFAEGALNDLSNDVLAAFATDLGMFFERFHNATTAADEAAAGYDLYHALRPYIETAALEQSAADYRLRLAYGTPEDDAAEAQEQAIADYAAKLVRDDEVAELVQELADAALPILNAIGAQQQATGRAPDYDTVRAMQRLRSIVKGVEAAA